LTGAPKYSERQAQASARKIEARLDLFEAGRKLPASAFNGGADDGRIYADADLLAEIPALAAARDAWRGLELPPDVMRTDAQRMAHWMMTACACPAFPPGLTRLAGAIALDLPVFWQGAPMAARAAYVAIFARDLCAAYERVERWRDADICGRLYHAMMMMLPQHKPAPMMSAPMPGAFGTARR
jgi:hypothetical protein